MRLKCSLCGQDLNRDPIEAQLPDPFGIEWLPILERVCLVCVWQALRFGQGHNGIARVQYAMTRRLQGSVLISLPRQRADRRIEVWAMKSLPVEITTRRLASMFKAMRVHVWYETSHLYPRGGLWTYLQSRGASAVNVPFALLRRLRRQYGIKGRVCETLMDSDRWRDLADWRKHINIEKQDWEGSYIVNDNATIWLLMNHLHWIAFVPVRRRLEIVKYRQRERS